jgi:hypothetical protein
MGAANGHRAPTAISAATSRHGAATAVIAAAIAAANRHAASTATPSAACQCRRKFVRIGDWRDGHGRRHICEHEDRRDSGCEKAEFV